MREVTICTLVLLCLMLPVHAGSAPATTSRRTTRAATLPDVQSTLFPPAGDTKYDANMILTPIFQDDLFDHQARLFVQHGSECIRFQRTKHGLSFGAIKSKNTKAGLGFGNCHEGKKSHQPRAAGGRAGGRGSMHVAGMGG